MSYSENPYQAFGLPADRVAVDARVEFIRKTYIHLTGAVLAFALICAVLLQIPAVDSICRSFVQNRFMYLIAMFGLMGVSMVCTRWVSQPTSIATQYAGLALYTVAEAIFFLPMLWVAQHFFPGSITSAGAITVAVFSGLTLSVFITKADFSFLRSALFIGGFALIGIAICAMFFPIFNNNMFSLVLGGAFVVLAAGYILYHTSMVLHHYPVNMHVAAALALFASLATLFWYILQLMMSRRN
ncbi:MAG: Bax inhibitor-1 family protein [Planctomycetia bacterium]|nr:Bax inhibitor-1 family protein [Planctomycetia bacterium]